MRLALCVLAAICLLAVSVTAVFAVPLQRQMLGLADDFEGYGDEYFVPLYVDRDGDGTITDADWQTWGGAPPTPTDDKFAKVTVLEDGNHVAWLKDNQQTGNAQIYSNFFAPLVNPPTERISGKFEVTMDVMPIDGTFKIDLTTGGTFTTGGNWIVGVGFGGDDNSFFPGAVNGQNIILQTSQGGTGWVNWVTTDAEYFRDIWYSLKFDVDVDNELYRFYYGEKGAGELTEVTTGWTGWITQQNTDPETLGGMLVATSGTGTQSGELYLDNVHCTPEPASILAFLSLVGLIPALRRRK